jgi:hypothetical protein
MAFDSSKPANNSPIVSQELRDQLNALKDLIDAQAAQIASLQSALNTRAARPTMGEFDPGFSDPPTFQDLQNVQAVINDLITQLENG